MAPAVLEHPEARTTRRSLMAKTTLDRARILRKVLREAEDRYRNELMDDEERMLLQNRIGRLRHSLKLATKV